MKKYGDKHEKLYLFNNGRSNFPPGTYSVEPDIENAQVIGVASGLNEEYAFRNLFEANKYLLKTNFNEIFCYPLEDIIKIQHDCKSTPYWKSQLEKYNFLMIMHEHLFVFRKPRENEELSKFRNSMIFKSKS